MAKKQEQEILGRAMLVNVRIGAWSARKRDKDVTRKVNEEYGASQEAGSWWKKLFGGPVEELGEVTTAIQYLRGTHYAHTLPWNDVGWRLLPTANYMEYRKAMREKLDVFEAARDRWVEVVEQRAKEAKAKLGRQYREADYPSAAAVKSKYYAEIEYGPIPSGEDFRVSLPKEELNRVAREVEERTTKFVERAMQEAWARLGEMVTLLKEKLEKEAKGLRGETLGEAIKIERVSLGELVDTLGRLNLTQDPALEKVRKQVQAQLSTLDVQYLKDNESARDKAAAQVADILKQVKSVYNPPQEDE